MGAVLLACLLAVSLPARQPSAQAQGEPVETPAAAWVVNTLVDESDGSCSNGDCALRDAIALAAPGDTITFNVAGQITLSLGQLVISKNLAIRGPGRDLLTISANNSSRVINISAGPAGVISLSGLTIAEGNSSSAFGGGVYNATITGGSQLTLSNCRLADNRTNANGGGLYSSGALTVTNCEFSDNQASSGGGVMVSFGSANITASRFTGNTASDDGGGIYLSNNATLDLHFSHFWNNHSQSEGGGIAGGSGTRITAHGCTFEENRALWGGGLSSKSTALLEAGSFFDNTAFSTGFNNGEGYGGGIYANGLMTVTNTTVYSNTAEAGGGIYNHSGATLTLLNGALAANKARFSGDNLYNGGYLLIQNSLLASAPQDNCSSGFNFLAGSTHNLSTDATCAAFSASFAQTTPGALNLAWQGWMLHPGAGSPAIDAGENSVCTPRDGRNWPRPWDGDGNALPVCDIGPVEVVPGLQRLYLPAVRR